MPLLRCTFPEVRVSSPDVELAPIQGIHGANYMKAAARRLPDWTLLVYMAAANNLRYWAHADLRKMKAAPTSSDLTVVVQLDRQHQGATLIDLSRPQSRMKLGDQNMGRPEVLYTFLRRAVEKHKARHYALILWGHGYRFGFGVDNGRALTMDEIADVLRRFRRLNAGRSLDVIGFNSCHMSTIEAAYELRGCAKFMVASQIGIPLTSWPYADILRRIEEATRGPRVMTPVGMGHAMVREFAADYRSRYPTSRVALSLVDLDRTQRLTRLTALLAAALLSSIPRTERAFDRAATPWRRDAFVDLRQLCLELNAGRPRIPAVSQVLAVLTSRESPVLMHAGHRATGLHGLSVYAPMQMGARYFRELRGRYRDLHFARKTDWQRLLARVCALALRPTHSSGKKGMKGKSWRGAVPPNVLRTLIEWDPAFVTQNRDILESPPGKPKRREYRTRLYREGGLHDDKEEG